MKVDICCWACCTANPRARTGKHSKLDAHKCGCFECKICGRMTGNDSCKKHGSPQQGVLL